MTTPIEPAHDWPADKMALWRVLMDEKLNDGHYIKAFDLIEKLYAALAQTAPAEVMGEPACYVSQKMLDRLNTSAKGAINTQVSNTPFIQFQVPLYLSTPTQAEAREAGIRECIEALECDIPVNVDEAVGLQMAIDRLHALHEGYRSHG